MPETESLPREKLIADISTEKQAATRTYHAIVTGIEPVDQRVVRVSIKSNRMLDGVKDRLEAGSAARVVGVPEGSAEWNWSIVAVGEDSSEADVIYLVPIVDGTFPPPVGAKLLLRPFDFVGPLLVCLDPKCGNRWFQRTVDSLDWMFGVRSPGAASTPDKVFRADIGSGWNAELGCIWGPPGTGKTWTLGQQVAEAAKGGKRILVVSTTNDACDVAAAEIMSALGERGGDVMVKRVGSGLRHSKFQNPGNPKFFHPSVVPKDDPVLVAEIALKEAALEAATTQDQKASIKAEVRRLRMLLKDAATRYMIDMDCRVVVTTAFTAISRLSGSPPPGTVRKRVEQGPIFDTLCVDEAGLVSAPFVAALAPYSSTRIVLFGDPRQLAPIAQMSKYLRRSSLSVVARPNSPTTTILRAQRRMDPPIRAVVSGYTYSDTPLQDGGLEQRNLPELPRAVCPGQLKVVFLDDAVMGNGRPIPLSNLAAERGAGGRSYRRVGTGAVLESMIKAIPGLANLRTAFISPFRAQVKGVRDTLAGGHAGCALGKGHAWTFTTVHAQQGGEAPLVLFDTVDLTKAKDWHVVDHAVGMSEWQRLLNVAISRGQRTVLILTTRQEWRSSLHPHVRNLRKEVEQSTNGPHYMTWNAEKGALVPVDPEKMDPLLRAPRETRPDSFGERIETIKAQRPVLTAEQLRLTEDCRLSGPRLIRGAPGSGKTLALAEWAVRSQAAHPNASVAIVHFTKDLGTVLCREVAAAGERLKLAGAAMKVQVLGFYEQVVRLYVPDRKADWQCEVACTALLSKGVQARFDIVFVDEAQDFGPAGIRYLHALAKGQNIRVFLDPMQATGSLCVTDWVAHGFAHERITVLRESHRSTRQIADMAMNLYAALGGSTDTMKADDLVFAVDRHRIGSRPIEVLATDFVEHEGPAVEVHRFSGGNSRNNEFDWVAREIVRLFDEQDLKPPDIGIVVNPFFLRTWGVGAGFPELVLQELKQRLPGIGFKKGLNVDPDTIQVHALHAVKGLEFEVVIMVGADTLAPFPNTERSIRGPDLYTAATRAREKLIITGTEFPTATDRFTGLSVLDVAEQLAKYLDSPEFEEERVRKLIRAGDQ